MGSRSERTAESGVAGARRVAILATVFVLGVALGSLVRGWREKPIQPAGYTQSEGMSETTKAVLSQLSAPVEIRFYSILDPKSTSESTRAFSSKVRSHLLQFEREAPDRVKLSFHERQEEVAEASADGIRPFNIDKGDACFLGVALASPSGKEVLGHLDPAWEGALEADLTRALQRVSAARPDSPGVAPAPVDPETLAAVTRRFPNLAGVSLEDATRQLRQDATEEFRKVVMDLTTEIKAVQERVKAAEASQSAAELEQARQELQRLQTQQTDKLKEIAARNQVQIEALQRLKSSKQ